MNGVKIESSLKNNKEFKITDYGIRKVLSQNFSRLATIPKEALIDKRTNREAKRVKVERIQENDTSYIKLIPIFEAEPTEI